MGDVGTMFNMDNHNNNSKPADGLNMNKNKNNNNNKSNGHTNDKISSQTLQMNYPQWSDSEITMLHSTRRF